MKTTADSITHDQIRDLHAEASRAGDLAMIAICDRALGGTDTTDDYMPPEQHERRAFARAMAMSESEAIEECARVISERS